jgi:hypothetical protein
VPAARHKVVQRGGGSRTIAGMSSSDTLLYEHFESARVRAVELTDRYRATACDDPAKGLLWDGVVRQTELARCLLESWLRSGSPPDPPSRTVNVVAQVR